ncbi:MAG: DUF1302 domain-containing protein [Gammaproteobacteria bacterium]|nr:DUF1302 domain-containing protein [Gammaproteobacteria bacterium]
MATAPIPAVAWNSADGSWVVHGYLDNTTHERQRVGLSKMRNRAAAEFTKDFGAAGPFSAVRLQGTLRASYDAVYDINSGHWGDDAGHAVTIENQGGPATIAGGSPLAGAPFINTASHVQWGQGFGSSQNPLPPGFFNPPIPGLPLNGGGFGFDLSKNPNQGLRIVGEESFKTTGGFPGFGGVQLAYPTRPCDIDNRGCIPGYMDKDSDELKFSEFNERQDWLRELYMDFELPVNMDQRIVLRVGRQQVVWGRTDLFRVLDVINPVDYSIQNIYEELGDSRIPLGIVNAEYQFGATGPFASLNVQAVWIAEPFRPSVLGQGGQPYSILDAGPTFRALKNCWDNGCTVGNFAPNNNPNAGPALAGFALPNGLLATDFPRHSIGIRQANIPDWKLENTQFGMRLEGEIKGFGFSLNALSYYSQLPSLHGGQSAVNPFIALGVKDFSGEVGGTEKPRPYLIAFDINFPRIFLVGGSLDTSIDAIKSTFRVEFAHTNGEEFANTLRPQLFSKSRVIRWVVGWDRPTWIKFLNPNRTFILSAQIFGQHLLDHELVKLAHSAAGMPDWENNFIGTFLIQGNYMNDRLTPQLIMAYDVRARASAVAPSVTWLITDHWQMSFGANLKFGRRVNQFDDNRIGNPFPPYTDPSFGLNPATGVAGQVADRIGGATPLGIFRSGPLGTASTEDELQLTVRYRF